MPHPVIGRVLLWAGCDGSERAALRVARDEAAVRASTVEPDWSPDASLVFPLLELERLSIALLDDVLARAPGVSATLPGGIPALGLDPRLHVEGLAMRAHPTRADRLLASGELVGTVGASVGERSVGFPVRVELALSLRLDVQSGSVLVRLDEIETVRVQAGAWRSAKGRRGKGVEEFLRGAIGDDPPHAFITRTGEGGLPVLAARLEVDGRLVRIHLRTDAPAPASALPPLPRPVPERGVALAMHDATLSALVRREVFRAVDGKLRPFVDPLRFDVGDGRVSGRVRLWNPGWPAWWQDFRVEGPVSCEGGGLRVGLSEVRPEGGIGWLGSGRLLAEPLRDALGEVLGGRLRASLPDEVGKDVNTVRLGARVTGISEAPEAFVLAADVSIGAGPAR